MVGHNSWHPDFDYVPKPRVRDAHLVPRSEAELDALDRERGLHTYFTLDRGWVTESVAQPAPQFVTTSREPVIAPLPLPKFKPDRGTWKRALSSGQGWIELDVRRVRLPAVVVRSDAPAWFTTRGKHTSHWSAIRPTGAPAYVSRLGQPSLFDVCIISHDYRGPAIDPPSPYVGSLNACTVQYYRA